MRAFVTGATGFVGRHLIRFLADRSIDVIAFTRSRHKTVVHKNIIWVEQTELSDSEWLRKQLSNVDVVVHLAAYAHQTRKTDLADKEKFYEVNVNLTKILHNAANSQGVSHFVFISSIGACASNSDIILDESFVSNPINDYGKSKLEAELDLKKELNKKNTTSVTIIRPSLVYGPSNPGNMERLEKFISLRIPLPFKSIKNKRSYLYIENMTDFIYQCLVNEKSKGQLFHLADDDILSTPELIELISMYRGLDVLQFKCPLIILKALGMFGDLLKLVIGRSIGIDSYSIEKLTGSLFVSNERAKKTMNWSPIYTTKEGIEKTYKKSGC